MKLKNTTTFPDHLLRRMVGWCRRQIGLPAAQVRRAKFGRRRWSYSGWAWQGGEICVKISVETFTCPKSYVHRGVQLDVPDAISAVVYVTAHELTHLHSWWSGADAALRESRDLEPHCVRQGKRVMLAFLADREALLAEWGREPRRRAALPRPTAAERRAERARRNLERWLTKLRLAQTKVRKLKGRVAYYDRRAAERSESDG